MPEYKVENGMFNNDIPYVKWGNGKKVMVIFSGGPGNILPKGMSFSFMTKCFEPFTNEYTLYMVGRKRHLKEGYTTKDISDDYAEMVKYNFNGKVDVILGESFGGMTAQHFAADYPDYFKYMIIGIASHKMSKKGKEVDYNFAKFISEGKYRKAGLTIVDALYPEGILNIIFKILFWLFGGLAFKGDYEAYNNDILIEAQAEVSHNSDESLKRINAPVLIIAGTSDFYFPEESLKEMHSLIKGSVLKLYENKGHADTFSDKRFSEDIFKFINSNG